MRRNQLLSPSFYCGRLPLIKIGDSLSAGAYIRSAQAPAYLRAAQVKANWAYHMFCHQGNDPASNISSDAIVPLGPFATTNADLRVSWSLDLGWRLSELGFAPTILDYSIGGSTIDYYNPTIVGNSYAAFIAWIKARLALLPMHRDPLVVLMTGTNGIGTDSTFAAGVGHMIEQLRTDLKCPHMGIIMCRPPASMGQSFGGVRLASITGTNEFVALDPYARVATCDGATYTDNANPVAEGLACDATWFHIDSVSGRRFANDIARQVQSLVA